MAIKTGSADLGILSEGVLPRVLTPAEKHAAAVTTAEAAIAGGWPREDLVDVLGSLGLTEEATS